MKGQAILSVALYARYSSDNQGDASIEDQLRLCRERAEREGWQIVDSYSDRSVSGASLIRPGVQALMQDAQAGRFNLVLTESLDRISRDQEDIAGAYKCLTFAGVRMVALSEGDINELHIGLKGTYSSHTRIARTELEHRILHALRTHLMSAVLFKEFCEEYTREINRLRMEASSGLAAKRAELEQVERQIRTMIEAIKDGLYRSSMKAEMDALEDRKEQLLRELEHVEEPPALLHPSIAAEYRKGVDGLLIALEDEQTRLEASDDVRSLVGRIVIT